MKNYSSIQTQTGLLINEDSIQYSNAVSFQTQTGHTTLSGLKTKNETMDLSDCKATDSVTHEKRNITNKQAV